MLGGLVKGRAVVVVLCGVVVLGDEKLRAGAIAENSRSGGGGTVMSGSLLVICGRSLVFCD
jgi:hypothetical protein